MKQEKTNGKTGVIATVLSLIAIVVIFEFGKANLQIVYFVVLEFSAILVFLLSFFLTYAKTGLWKFTHKPLKELDEREIALTSKSLRYAYGIFSVTVLALLLSLAITETQIDIVLVVSLMLFAHIIPASVIAWTEKIVLH